MADEPGLPKAPLLTLVARPEMAWRCPECGTRQDARLSWPELADVIDGGTLETACRRCGAPVELSGMKVIE